MYLILIRKHSWNYNMANVQVILWADFKEVTRRACIDGNFIIANDSILDKLKNFKMRVRSYTGTSEYGESK